MGMWLPSWVQLLVCLSPIATHLCTRSAALRSYANFSDCDRNVHAKHAFLRSQLLRAQAFGGHQASAALTYYELSPTHHRLGTKYPWHRATMYVLAAQWAPNLPSVELLTFLRPVKPRVSSRFTVCWGRVPAKAPRCHYPRTGVSTAATFVWPTNRALLEGRRYYYKKTGSTTTQYFCPIPPQELHVLAHLRPTQLSVILDDTEGHNITVTLRQVTRPLHQATVCPHALYNYRRIEALYPGAFYEWLEYHRQVGFDHFHVYDEVGDFEAPLQPWLTHTNPAIRGYVRYYPRFPDPLNYASGLSCCCNEAMTLDHCLFVNQLTSKWVMVVHSFDMFVHFNRSFGGTVPGVLERFVSEYRSVPFHKVAEVIIRTRSCGKYLPPDAAALPAAAGTAGGSEGSLLRQVEVCGPTNGFFHFTTPVYNPRNVQSTIIHRALLYAPGTATLLVPASWMTTLHYSSTRPARWKLETQRYGAGGILDNMTELAPLWPQVHARVEQLRNSLPNLESQSLTEVIPEDTRDSVKRHILSRR